MSKPKSKVITVQVVGPLEPYAGQLMGVLAVRGYAPLTRVPHLQVMTHLSKWMAARQLAVAELTAAQVDEYLGQRRRGGYVAFCTRTSLAPLLEVLASAGAPLDEPDPPVSAVDALLDGYARFLLQERGLAASTISAYVLRSRRFLQGHGHGADLSAVDTAAVTHAVLAEADTVSAGSAQFFAVALRSFLRYCYLRGLLVFVAGLADGDRVAQQRTRPGARDPGQPHPVPGGFQEPIDRGPRHCQQLRPGVIVQPCPVEFAVHDELGQPDPHRRGEVLPRGLPGEHPHADQ